MFFEESVPKDEVEARLPEFKGNVDSKENSNNQIEVLKYGHQRNMTQFEPSINIPEFGDKQQQQQTKGLTDQQNQNVYTEELQQNLDPAVLQDVEFTPQINIDKSNSGIDAKYYNYIQGSVPAVPPKQYYSNSISDQKHNLIKMHQYQPNEPYPIEDKVFKQIMKNYERRQPKPGKYRSKSRKTKKELLYQDRLYEQLKQMGFKNPSSASFETGEESIQQRSYGLRDKPQFQTPQPNQLSQFEEDYTYQRGDNWIQQVDQNANITPKTFGGVQGREIGTSPSPFTEGGRGSRQAQQVIQQYHGLANPQKNNSISNDIHYKRAQIQTSDQASRPKRRRPMKSLNLNQRQGSRIGKGQSRMLPEITPKRSQMHRTQGAFHPAKDRVPGMDYQFSEGASAQLGAPTSNIGDTTKPDESFMTPDGSKQFRGIISGPTSGSVSANPPSKKHVSYNAKEPIIEKRQFQKQMKKGNGFQQPPAVGKLILKKINHFHDERRIDQSYATGPLKILDSAPQAKKESRKQQNTPRLKNQIMRRAGGGVTSSQGKQEIRMLRDPQEVQVPERGVTTERRLNPNGQRASQEPSYYTQQARNKSSSQMILSQETTPIQLDQQRDTNDSHCDDPALSPKATSDDEGKGIECTDPTSEPLDDYGINSDANPNYEMRLKKHKTAAVDKRRKRLDGSKRRKKGKAGTFDAGQQAESSAMNEFIAKHAGNNDRRKDQLNHYELQLRYFQHQKQLSRLDQMEKLSKNRKKKLRHRSAPKRDRPVANKTVMNSQEYTNRDQTTPRRSTTKPKLGNSKRSFINTSRISNNNKEFQAYRVNTQIAPQTSEDRRNRIGDEHSVGSVFKPYRSSIKSDHNSPDYKDKYFGKKTFSQTGNGFDSNNRSASRNEDIGFNNKININRERFNTSKKKFDHNDSIMSTKSEVNRVLRRNDFGKTQKMELDGTNKAKMRFRESTRDPSLLIPEGMTADPRRELLSRESRSYSDFCGSQASSRLSEAQRAHRLLKKGMEYKFKLSDLNKYSSNLRVKDLNWKLNRSALGKVIPNVNKRKKELKKESYFNKLHKLLKQTDWSRTPVYHQFQRNGRWNHEDENIYGEQEIKYLKTSLQKMLSSENCGEFEGLEGRQILERHFYKTMHTLEVLLNQMNMMFYWERLRLYFVDKEPTLEQLEKLMSRILKLYQMIDDFMQIFKLVKKKEKLELALQQNSKIDDKIQEVEQTLRKRIQISIKLLLKENPVLPTFAFKGVQLLEKYKAEEKKHVEDEYKKLMSETGDDEAEGPMSINDSILRE